MKDYHVAKEIFPEEWEIGDGTYTHVTKTTLEFARKNANAHSLVSGETVKLEIIPIEGDSYIEEFNGKDMRSPFKKELDRWRVQRINEGYWTENVKYPVSDWQDEVSQDHTRESYDQWVENMMEQSYDE